jgi:hypothetical protein
MHAEVLYLAGCSAIQVQDHRERNRPMTYQSVILGRIKPGSGADVADILARSTAPTAPCRPAS